MNQIIHITIDGPSGAGKSTIAREVAKELGFFYVDTGALYRAAALGVLEQGIDPLDENAVTAVLPSMNIALVPRPSGQQTLLNDRDMSDRIRTDEISNAASIMAQYASVRTFLLDIQRDIAANHSLVMDGRDIGTSVLPNAQIKLYLTASARDRAFRRYHEMRAKGESVAFDDVYQEILQRDERDINRELSPLRRPPEAIELDTTGNTLDESIALVLKTIKERLQFVL
jgi:cytidylate kinase